jgi:homopolymeric O-antigen transport system permease protein
MATYVGAPIIIKPSSGWVPVRPRDLWEYRELLYFLIWRDVKIRYKQTVLGVLWAIIQPLLTMLVFSVFFGRLAQMPSDGIPYPIFAFSALVPWTLFAYGINQASNSVVGGAHLIKKVYFPRLILPVAAVLSGVIDFVLALVVLIGMMLSYGITPSAKMLVVVPLLALVLVTSLSVALWLSALNVEFRDVRYIIPFLTQVWLFATPIAYPSSLLSEPWRTLYAINPMVGVVEGFRWALLGAGTAPGPMVIVSSVIAVVLVVGGAFYFRRMERSFADVV